MNNSFQLRDCDNIILLFVFLSFLLEEEMLIFPHHSSYPKTIKAEFRFLKFFSSKIRATSIDFSEVLGLVNSE